MKVVILAGGQQSTISNEGEGIPKPMANIGERPILWHIMKLFSEQGLKDFIICGGYKLQMIKEYFYDFYIYQSDITVNVKENTIKIHRKKTEDWKVSIINTGIYSSTGERVSKVQKYLEGEDFIVTYGDCLSDINVREVLSLHREKKKTATLVLAKPSGRNALLPINNEGTLYNVDKEKIFLNEYAWINANMMVFKNDIFAYLDKNTDLEKDFFVRLAENKEMASYKHRGFWRAVETTRDRDALEEMWKQEKAPWKIWND